MKKKDKYTIFIVDDDPTFSEMLEVYLSENKNFILSTYFSAEQCIENLDKKPDIIILDHIFEKIGEDAMDGLTALQIIQEKQPETAVIILTGQNDPKMVFNFINNGARDYVVKDNDTFDNINAVIKEIIEGEDDLEDF